MKHRLMLTVCWVLIAMCGMRARADDAGFVYAYVLHDSHSQDTFYSVDFTKPVGPPAPVRPFFELLLQRDSRTVGGVLPQTLNDNFGLLGGGVQYQANSGLRVFGQVGTSFVFGPLTPTTVTYRHLDTRGGVEYYRDWNDPAGRLRRTIGSFYGDVIYYSRYKNVLMYFEAERGHEFGRSAHPFQVFARLSGSQDARRLYYNDALVISGGVRFLPLGRLGPSLGLEESFNTYTGSREPLVAANVGRSFWSFRPFLTFGASF